MRLNAAWKIASDHFYPFTCKAFEIGNPGTQFQDNWHLRAIAYQLETMIAGECRRLIITVPPRSLKSSMVSVALPAFLLGRNPADKIIVTSYAEILAEKLSTDTRTFMTSAFYQTVYPQTRLIKSTRLHLETEHGGGRLATSVGGAVTGFGADWIIIDDPHNASEAYSPSAREAVTRYYGSTLRTRLNDQTTGRIILVMQRLHEDDLAGHLLAQGGWEHLKLEAIATQDARYAIGRGKIHHVKAGDLLHERRLPQDLLDHIRRDMGSVAFEAQYQQEPVPADGNMIKRSWLRSYDTVPDRAGGHIILSFDTATKTNPANDFSVCTVWLKKDGHHYLLDVWRDKVDFPALRQKARELHQRYCADMLLIEDHGAGTSLIQELCNIGLPALARKARDSKQARLAAASSFIAAGLMLLPREAPWLGVLLGELLTFPGGRHDDQVDSLSQYFGWVRETPPSLFSWDMGFDDSPDHDALSDLLLALKNR